MAVRVFCDNPKQLLEDIKSAVRQRSIQTWTLDSDGDFTHSTEQWRLKAWMRPRIYPDKIVFNILGPRGEKMSRVIYAIYHGRFIEMLLNHFDERFSRATATALPGEGDWIGGD